MPTVHLGDRISFKQNGRQYEAEIICIDRTSSYMNVGIDVTSLFGIEGIELTKNQYNIWTLTSGLDFAKDVIGKSLFWINSSDVKVVTPGDGRSFACKIDEYAAIKRPPSEEELEEIENKKKLIKFFFKDVEKHTAPDGSGFKYI